MDKTREVKIGIHIYSFNILDAEHSFNICRCYKLNIIGYQLTNIDAYSSFFL